MAETNPEKWTVMLMCVIDFASVYSMSRLRRDWRNKIGNQNPYIEEEQTKQSPKEKVQKDKQRSDVMAYLVFHYMMDTIMSNI